MVAANSEEITPAALAQVARAWSDLEERKRILRMKPAPKPVDVPLKRAKRKPSVQGADLVPMPQVVKPPVLQPPTDGH